jgi:hypothetical protein
MGTRSHIGVRVTKDTKVGTRTIKAGEVMHAYCHWDGYPSNQIPILTGSYTKEAEVVTLLTHGQMSNLGKKCDGADGSITSLRFDAETKSLQEQSRPNCKHTFDDKVDDQTTYYGRDRGEEGCEFQVNTYEEDGIDEAYQHLNLSNGEK